MYIVLRYVLANIKHRMGNTEFVLKEIFLDALERIEKLSIFTSLSNEQLSFLKDFKDYRGLVLRFHVGTEGNQWQYQGFDEATQYAIDELFDLSDSLDIDNYKEVGLKNIEGNSFRIIITPYYKGPWHLADLILMLSPKTELPIDDWNLFADHIADRICSKYDYPDLHLTGNQFEAPDKSLEILFDLQRILNTNKIAHNNSISEHTQNWFSSDMQILKPFLQKVQREFNLYAVGIIQRAAPGYYNQICVVAEDEDSEPQIELSMLEDVIDIYEERRSEVKTTQAIIKTGKSEFNVVNPNLIGCHCQVGEDNYGYFGIFLTKRQKTPLVYESQLYPTPSKLMTMIANQLGLFFSQLFLHRKLAMQNAMLSAINIIINSMKNTTEISTIMERLADCFQRIFGQKSGAIYLFNESHELEKVASFEKSIPDLLTIDEILSDANIKDCIYKQGDVFNNASKRYSKLPIKFIYPLAVINNNFSAMEHSIHDFNQDGSEDAPPSLGTVIIFDSIQNRTLSKEEKEDIIPHFLQGISTSLESALSYREKLDTLKALEKLISELSNPDAMLDEMIKVISKTLKVDGVSYMEIDSTGKELHIKKSIGIPEEYQNSIVEVGQSISGRVAQTCLPYSTTNVETEGEVRKVSEQRYHSKACLSVPLKSKDNKILGVINVNSKKHLESSDNGAFSIQDQQLVQAIARLVSTALENVKYLEEKHERKALEKQLQDAKAIQMSLIPKDFSRYPESVEIYGRSIPAKEIGGDFFDIVQMKDGRLLAMLGDVSGKGMPAAIIMGVTRMILKPLALTSSDIVEIVTEANERLCNEIDSYHFVTLQAVAINQNTGECEMTSAGHGPLYTLSDSKNIIVETKSGTPLGIAGLPAKYTKQSFKLTPGDEFVMFTDGLYEETSPDKTMFGTDRIMEIMREKSNDSAKSLTETLIQRCQEWRGSKTEAHDDLTVLSIKYKGNN